MITLAALWCIYISRARSIAKDGCGEQNAIHAVDRDNNELVLAAAYYGLIM